MSHSRLFINLLFSVPLFFVGFSCSDNVAINKQDRSDSILETSFEIALDSKGFLEWYSDNQMNFIKKREFDGVFVEGKFIPYQIEYLLHGGDDKGLKDYQEYEYYTLSIGLKDSKKDFLKSGYSQLDYQSLVEYLSFKIQDDITLEVGKEILECKFSVFERSFGVKPSATLNLGFKTSDSKEARKLVYRDRIMSLGIVKLQVTDGSLIEKIPSIKI